MREEAFRRFLAQRLGARSVDSYLSNLRRVERVLTIDLDDLGTDERAIERLRAGLSDAQIGDRKIADCLSAFRAYDAFRNERAQQTDPARTPASRKPENGAAAVNRSSGLEHIPTVNLLAHYAIILHELRTRGIARGGNGPVGDYAEHLFARAFGWTLQPNSTAGFDARDPATALRYEIKARRLQANEKIAQLSALRRLPEQRFDLLAVLLLAPDFQVRHAALVPHAVVMEHATFAAHTNSWRLIVTPALLARPDVENVTRAIAAAAALDPVIKT